MPDLTFCEMNFLRARKQGFESDRMSERLRGSVQSQGIPLLNPQPQSRKVASLLRSRGPQDFRTKSPSSLTSIVCGHEHSVSVVKAHSGMQVRKGAQENGELVSSTGSERNRQATQTPSGPLGNTSHQSNTLQYRATGKGCSNHAIPTTKIGSAHEEEVSLGSLSDLHDDTGSQFRAVSPLGALIDECTAALSPSPSKHYGIPFPLSSLNLKQANTANTRENFIYQESWASRHVESTNVPPSGSVHDNGLSHIPRYMVQNYPLNSVVDTQCCETASMIFSDNPKPHLCSDDCMDLEENFHEGDFHEEDSSSWPLGNVSEHILIDNVQDVSRRLWWETIQDRNQRGFWKPYWR